jgi:multidrug efflux pump subunit AcrA (membrane-fusion protein)
MVHGKMKRLWTMDYRLSTVVLLLIIPLALPLAGCRGKKRETKKEVIPVRAQRVELRDIARVLDYAGTIEAEDKAEIYPKVSGKIIEKLKEEGSEVTKGETIAYIDRDEVGFKFEKAPVESPLTGIIGRVHVDRGTNVTPQTAIALVVNMDKVQINLDIPERYLPQVAIGMEAKIAVDAYPDGKFTGTVTKISPVVDVETRTAPIEITIDNPGHRLKPGMFARLKLNLEERKNVPVILKEAILGKEPLTYVYVVNGDVAHSRKVTLGIREGAYFEVREGLKEGDLVVIMGQQRLLDNAQVLVEEDKRPPSPSVHRSPDGQGQAGTAPGP